MNASEAVRITTVLQEALASLKILSFMTPELMASSDDIAEIVGQEATDAIAMHRQTLQDLESGEADGEALVASALHLCRVAQKRRTVLPRLAGMSIARSPASVQFLNYFERLCELVHTKLTTTVEEDVSDRGYHLLVQEREEKAVHEKSQLDHKLKLQRVERSKREAAMKGGLDAADEEIAAVKKSHAAELSGQGATAKDRREMDGELNAAEVGRLSAALEEAHKRLAAAQAAAKEGEFQLMKKKKNLKLLLEQAIQEYDEQMERLEADSEEMSARHAAVMAELESLQVSYEGLRIERADIEETDRKVEEEREKEAHAEEALDAAARVVQGAWKLFKEQQAATKGGKAKGKKK